MLGDLTPGALFAGALLLRQTDSRYFLFVEGPDEDLIFDRFLNKSDVYLIVAGGRKNVIGVCELIEQTSFLFACGLADRDLDSMLAVSQGYPSCLVLTDHYDLVADILFAHPGLLRHVCRMHGRDAVDALEAATGEHFEQSVALGGSKLLAVRVVSSTRSAEIPIGAILATCPFDANYNMLPLSLIVELLSQRGIGVGDEEIFVEVAEGVMRHIDQASIRAGGHDFFNVAAAVIRETKLAQVGERLISRSIFSAIDIATFGQLGAIQELTARIRAVGKVMLHAS